MTTRRQLARAIGKSERYVYQVIKNGTRSRSLAATFAKQLDGVTEDYYREPRQRGRERDLVALLMKAGENFTFREFIQETDHAAEESGTRDGADWSVFQFASMYDHMPVRGSVRPTPPDDFDDFEELFAFAKEAELDVESRDQVWNVWQRFKVWRIRQVADLAIFDIEINDG